MTKIVWYSLQKIDQIILPFLQITKCQNIRTTQTYDR